MRPTLVVIFVLFLAACAPKPEGPKRKLIGSPIYERLVGNDSGERRVNYKASIQGIVVQGHDYHEVRVTVIDHTYRTYYDTDDQGNIVYYYPHFDTCNAGFRVLRYHIVESVRGERETVESFTPIGCSHIRLKLLTKPIVRTHPIALKAQADFDALAKSIEIPVEQRAKPEPPPRNWNWKMITFIFILVLTAVALFSGLMFDRPRVVPFLCWLVGGPGLLTFLVVHWTRQFLMMEHWTAPFWELGLPVMALWLGEWIRRRWIKRPKPSASHA